MVFFVSDNCVRNSKGNDGSNSSASDDESLYNSKNFKQTLKKYHKSNKKINSNNESCLGQHSLLHQHLNSDTLKRLQNGQTRLSRTLQRENKATAHQRSSSSDGRCLVSHHNRYQANNIRHSSTGSSVDEESIESPKMSKKFEGFLSKASKCEQLSSDVKTEENFGNRLSSAIQELFVKRISGVSNEIKITCTERKKELSRHGSEKLVRESSDKYKLPFLTRSQSEDSKNSSKNAKNESLRELTTTFWKSKTQQVHHDYQSHMRSAALNDYNATKISTNLEDSGFSESPCRVSIQTDDFVVISTDDYTLCKTCPSLLNNASSTKHSPYKLYSDFGIWNGIKNISKNQERRTALSGTSAKAALKCMSMDIGMCLSHKRASPPTVEVNIATAKGQVYRKASHLKKSLLKEVVSPMESRSSSEESLSSIPVEVGRHNSPRVRRNHSDSSFEKTQYIQYSPQMAKRAVNIRRCRSSDVAALEESKEEAAVFEPEDPATCLRYYHVFKEGELANLIENHVTNLHVIENYYDHANWCVIAEKVNVWTI